VILLTLINFAIMGGFLYLVWCGLKWIILGPHLPAIKKQAAEDAALKRARKYGKLRPDTIDGGVIYPENKEPEEVLLIEHKRK
jgi:hypothetical protein